jgi:hypothetical protein
MSDHAETIRIPLEWQRANIDWLTRNQPPDNRGKLLKPLYDANDALDALVARCDALENALREADDLLRRLSEWDMLSTYSDGKPVTADGPYWKAEIARTRAALVATDTTREPVVRVIPPYPHPWWQTVTVGERIQVADDEQVYVVVEASQDSATLARVPPAGERQET